ncbi:hypothetical protein [Ornithinicoccus hortensis]|uniref:Uncharacterized protein n=1 Tax=Ornithinicoccus hortensis TaxID=82346 RepID=A0A542YRG5_9MICO|nr:hypothetical protein [Ornithinicoccus hortensis]TQL50692.1 hypothetical protein FB467_1806 [Ornithinicoccus hortensis]
MPWYQGLSAAEKAIALALHKSDQQHLTITEAQAKITKILEGKETLVEEDAGYDSGADHDDVAVDDRILTVQEFEALPEKGRLNPFKLRTVQPGIELHFADKSKGKVADLGNRLAEDPELARRLPAVKIGVYKGRVYSFDTRRVVACQMARAKNPAVVISFEKINEKDKATRVSSVYGARPWMGIVTAMREAGMRSGSRPHINPAYEAQLSDRVHLSWDITSHIGFPKEQPKISEEGDDDAEAKAVATEVINDVKEEQREKGSGESGVLPAEPTDDLFSGLEKRPEPEKGMLLAELEKLEKDLAEWAKGAEATLSSQRQIEHAQQIWAYIVSARKQGLNRSALNGWMLDDVFERVNLLPRNAKTQFLWEWRIPRDPGNSRAPLIRKLRGG